MSNPEQQVEALACVLWIWSVVAFCLAGILQLLGRPRVVHWATIIGMVLLGLGLLRQAWSMLG